MSDLIDPKDLFVCPQMGADVRRVRESTDNTCVVCGVPNAQLDLHGACSACRLRAIIGDPDDVVAFQRATPDILAEEHKLPPLPAIDTKNSIGYEAIRYVPGYTENFCKNYALQYALAVLKEKGYQIEQSKIPTEPRCPRCGQPKSVCFEQKNFPDPEPLF